MVPMVYNITQIKGGGYTLTEYIPEFKLPDKIYGYPNIFDGNIHYRTKLVD